MAVTSYGVGSPVAVKVWSRKLFEESLKATWAQKFMGTSSNSLIQVQTDLKKGPGDRITIPLRSQLTGIGVQGDGTLEGNEEGLIVNTDNLIIDQIRHAVRSAGKMSEQRIPFSVREEARMGLTDWFADRYDAWFFNQICGFTAQSDTRYTGLQATIAPDSAHYINAHGAGSQDENIVSTDKFTLPMIDYAVEKAQTLTTPIRPIRIDGADKYVMFLHPNQVVDLRTNTATGQWFDIQRAILQGGQSPKENPIYSGALGEYNGVILHQAFRVTNGVNSTSGAAIGTVKRAVLAGAQAALMAYGQDVDSGTKMTWVEELFDYENQLGVSGGTIAGLKKTRFNGMDFATIVISTYGATHS